MSLKTSWPCLVLGDFLGPRHLLMPVRGVGGEHTPIGADGTIDLSPSARLCIEEAEIVTALYQGIEALLEKEKARERERIAKQAAKYSREFSPPPLSTAKRRLR